MNVDENQELLIDIQSNVEEIIPFMVSEVYDWSTSLLSEICRQGDIHRLRFFIEYSRQTSHCAEHASAIVDRLDVESGLSPLHHAARYQHLHICLMLLSNIHFIFGVNIKDVNDRTPMHSVFRSSDHLFNKENQFEITTDFGNEIQSIEVWQDRYSTKLFLTDHPLIYLFAKAHGNINATDKYLLTPLHCAVARNNLSGVKQLIGLNADIECEDRQRIRPLHLACKEGYLSIVEYLIKRGTKINSMDVDQWTPMHYACAKGHLEIVQLINSQAEFHFEELLQMKTNTGATCLHLAVQSGSIQLVEYILKKFTNHHLKFYINQQAQPFGTPLHIAAKFSESSMVDLLYSHGADPLILNFNEQSPLHIASAFNRLSIVRTLYNLTQTSLLESRDHHGQTALFMTTHPDIIDELIVYGADISSLDDNHRNAVMTAVLAGHMTIVYRFLSVINNRLLPILDQVDQRNNRSLFLLAVQTGSIDMCSLLLTHPYIRWDTVDKQRLNAFHIAAQNNHYELIQFLCNHIQKSEKLSRSYSIATTTESEMIYPSTILRLYLDAQDEDGQTPLHFASEQGHRLCIKILCKYGANVFLANVLDQLPFHAAVQNGHSSCVDFLIQIFKKNLTEFQSVSSRLRQSPLIVACQYGFVDIVKILLTENLGIDFGYNKEDNPLEIAIRYRQIEIIDILLEHPLTEQWLLPKRNNHQTPLRDLIRYLPFCAKHAMDKLILKTTEIDFFGEKFERIVYKYKYIDDYFINDDQLYTTNSRRLYRNHPLIIALDNDHHFLLEHPLVQQIMIRKWKQYRLLFYFPRVLAFLLISTLTFYVLITPAPIPDKSLTKNLSSVSIQWIILGLSVINLLKILFEIFLYRGLRVPFAQLLGMVSFISSILAFLPFENPTKEILSYQWQIASLAILFQWFHIVALLRSISSFGISIFMIELIVKKLTFLLLMIFPLVIGFSISGKMIFYKQTSLMSINKGFYRIFAMSIGEFDYERLFFSKSIFPVAIFLFIAFVLLMTVVFVNLLLGIAIEDIKSSITNARTRANAYRIRELIYIESILPSKTWLKSFLIEDETIDHYLRDSMANQTDDFSIDQSDRLESRKLFHILHMLCTQAKQVFEYEISLELQLKQLINIRKLQGSD